MKLNLKLIPFLLLPLLFVGCGGERVSRLPTQPVEGTVQLDGRPLEGAFVVLHPKGATDPKVLAAQAKTDASGKFKPTTYDVNDGAIEGEYRVTVEYFELVKTDEGTKAGPNILPPKYASPATTDLTIRVAKGENKLPIINLTR
jgi:hypothetical protein